MAKYGWVSGSGAGRNWPVGNASAIKAGQVIKAEASGLPYITPCVDDDQGFGIAAEDCDAPSADGDVSIFVYDDPTDVFYLPVLAGTLTTAYRGRTADLEVTGTVHGLDLATQTDDFFYILEVDVANNACYVRCDFNAAFTKS